MTRHAQARVPLVIGVSGHRDLVPEEVPVLERAVSSFLDDLKTRFPDLPLLLITPLAEGADRLVARVAVAAGIPLTVLLPMPADIYRTDFDEGSDAVFETMRLGSECVELPLLEGTCPETVSRPGPARDRQYEYLGLYLAAHCHVLLALWDGRDSRAPGGTAQVIRSHQQDKVELLGGDARSPIDFSEDESDLVHHIACSRREAGRPVDGLQPGEAAWLTRDDLTPRTPTLPDRYAAVFRRQAEFNRDLGRLDPPSERGTALSPDGPVRADSVLADIENLYACADALALRFQRIALRALGMLFAFILVTGASFILYADFTGLDLMIYGYLLSLIVVLILYGVERKAQWYRRYLDYRALAEGLRVQFYWALAGVTGANPARFAHDSFLRRQDLELGWIRNLMRFAGRRADASRAAADPADIERAIAGWIGNDEHGQLRYYRQALARSARRSRRTSLLANACFAGGIVIAVILALWGAHQGDSLRNLLIALMGGLPFAAAVRQSYAFRTAERELVAQYAHMARLFSNAHRLLTSETTVTGRRDILRALGEAALDENGLWLLRQRERPLSSGQLFPG